MERNEVIISLTKEEVKELKIILQKKKIDLEYYSSDVFIKDVETLDQAIKDLSEDKLVINKDNKTYIFPLLWFTAFPISHYERAKIVYDITRKIADVDFKTEGEAHE